MPPKRTPLDCGCAWQLFRCGFRDLQPQVVVGHAFALEQAETGHAAGNAEGCQTARAKQLVLVVAELRPDLRAEEAAGVHEGGHHAILDGPNAYTIIPT